MLFHERSVAVLKRVTAVLCLCLLVCAIASLPAVQTSDTSPPVVAVLVDHVSVNVNETKLTGDPWTDPCVPRCAALTGGGNYLGLGIDTGTGDYPLLL